MKRGKKRKKMRQKGEKKKQTKDALADTKSGGTNGAHSTILGLTLQRGRRDIGGSRTRVQD